MTGGFFANVTTLEELRAEFLRLIKLHHPDLKGGDTETMKLVNSAYTAATKRLLKTREDGDVAGGKKAWSEGKWAHWEDLSEKMRATIEKLLLIEEVEVDLRGYWLWISGGPVPAPKGVEKTATEEALRKAGCKYSASKDEWYFQGIPSSGRGKMTKEEIKAKYGSEKVKAKGSKRSRSTSSHAELEA